MKSLLKLFILIALIIPVLAAANEPLNYKKAISILGVPFGADKITVTKAFRTLAMKYHPDRVNLEQKNESEEKFKEIKLAYDFLKEMEFKSPPSDNEIYAFKKDYELGLEMVFNPVDSYILYKKYKESVLNALDNKNIPELSQLLFLTNPSTTSIFVVELLRHKNYSYFKDFFIQKIATHQFTKYENETFRVLLHAFTKINKLDYTDIYFALLKSQNESHFVDIASAPAYISINEIIRLKNYFINEVKNGNDTFADSFILRLITDGKSNVHYKAIREMILAKKGEFSIHFFSILLQHPNIRGSQMLLAEIIKRIDYKSITPHVIEIFIPNYVHHSDQFINFLLQRNNTELIKTILEGFNKNKEHYSLFDKEKAALFKQKASLVEKALKIQDPHKRLKYIQKHFSEQGRFLELFNAPTPRCLDSFAKLINNSN